MQLKCNYSSQFTNSNLYGYEYKFNLNFIIKDLALKEKLQQFVYL